MLNTESADILIVDDDPVIRVVISEILGSAGYQVQEAENGETALDRVRHQAPDLILLDAVMPGINGFEVARALKQSPESESIPIIMVTSLQDVKSRERGLLQGVEEFVSKPINPIEIKFRVRNLLKLKLANDILKHHNELLEGEVRLRSRELQNSFEEGLYMLMRAAEYRDDETGAHIQRISLYTRLLAESIGMDPDYCNTIFLASPMHDIGKIGIPDHILLKSGELTPHEWEVMKTHTTIGEKILEGGYSPYIRMGQEIARSHHEHWDGSGYPSGLGGEDIPLPARIMAICDVYDALRSKRPYKPAYDHDKAIEIIFQGDGRVQPSHFDPDVREAFLARKSDMQDIFESMQD